MKTLEQIKNEYSVSKGYITIIDIINECIIEHDHERILQLINDISIESQKECLKLSSDNILFNKSKQEPKKNFIVAKDVYYDDIIYITANKESITNKNNIIK